MRRVIGLAIFLYATAAWAQPLPDASQEVVKGAILTSLKDPGSAQFSRLSGARQPTGETVVCGMVNAKNGFGGYVGPMPFSGKLYDDGNFYLTKLANSSAEGSNLIALCAALGATISD